MDAPGEARDGPGRTGTWADRILIAAAGLGAAAVAGIFLLVLSSVVMRYLVQAPFRFADEFAGLLLGAALFLTLPFVLWRGDHIRVTLLSDRLRGPAARVATALGWLVLIAFAVIFLKEAWAIAAFTDRLGLRSEQARLPLAPFLWMTVASVGLLGSIGLVRLLRAVVGARQ